MVSFECILFQVDTPRNGLIAAWKTKKFMKKGEQIFSNYGYQYHPDDIPHPSYEWYKKEWEAFYGPVKSV